LSEEVKSSLFRERAFFLHQFVHSTTVAILIDKVKVVGSFKHIDVLDDIGAAL